MKKRLLLGLLVVMVLFCITACGSSENAKDENKNNSSSENQYGATSSIFEEKESETESINLEDGASVEVIESGYSVSESFYMTYVYIIENKSETTAYEFPRVFITAYDSDGNVLATEEQVMNSIQPGEKQAFCSVMDCNEQLPAKVEMIAEAEDKIVVSDTAIKSSDFEITGTTERIDKYGDTAITGKIKNNSKNDTECVCVVVLFRKEGKLVDGGSTFIDNIKSGKEKPFEISEYNISEHDSYEVIAINWD